MTEVDIREGLAQGRTLHDILLDILWEAMRERHWTQDQLAVAAGISQSHLSRILSGKRSGPLKTWQQLLQAIEEPPCP